MACHCSEEVLQNATTAADRFCNKILGKSHLLGDKCCTYPTIAEVITATIEKEQMKILDPKLCIVTSL